MIIKKIIIIANSKSFNASLVHQADDCPSKANLEILYSVKS
jgi:hypothetical protein